MQRQQDNHDGLWGFLNESAKQKQR